MPCLLLLLALAFCEPDEAALTRQYVDYAVGLYFREYVVAGKEIVVAYQVAGTDLKDDTIDVLPRPLLVTINRQMYVVACEPARCWLQTY